MTQNVNKTNKPATVATATAVGMQVVIRECNRLRDQIFKESDPERAQALKRQVDDIITDIASLQKECGAIRKECTSHVQNVRKANPSKKGKPSEGEERMIGGKAYIFTGGRFFLLEKEAPTSNEES